MGTRTVRLDDAAEKALARVRKATGLSVSEVLKRGLETLEQQITRRNQLRPYDIYQRLDLGLGGWSIAPASDSKRAVRDAVRRKLGR